MMISLLIEAVMHPKGSSISWCTLLYQCLGKSTRSTRQKPSKSLSHTHVTRDWLGAHVPRRLARTAEVKATSWHLLAFCCPGKGLLTESRHQTIHRRIPYNLIPLTPPPDLTVHLNPNNSEPDVCTLDAILALIALSACRRAPRL
jgi:hypothetical protein